MSFTAVTGQIYFFTVRDGDDVTLPCTGVIPDQDQCSQTWRFTNPPGEMTEFVFSRRVGHPGKKLDRQSVSANCSLVIKKVTVNDAGRYVCMQRDVSGSKHEVILSVVTSEYLHQNIWILR
uniref:Ig-like domain-containing protein n=1 Tax=Sphaeramia orbicularis TaxID=375764 RepID=A0A673C279_9TELE